jgi:protein gp37
MSDKTKIPWTDATWNTVVGCSKVSPGCEHCCAEKLLASRLKHMPLYGEATRDGRLTGEAVLLPDRLDQPLRWKRARKIFVNDLGDTFHPTVPLWFIDSIFRVIESCPQHTFQILTKRPARMQWYLSNRLKPLPNLWLGVTCENQFRANQRISLLLQCPAAVRFVSAEPLLESVDFTRWIVDPCDCLVPYQEGLDWIIVGGESGPKARPCDVEWIRSIRDQCEGTGTRCFVKQLGSNAVIDEQVTVDEWRVRPYVTSDRAGADPAEWPEDLQVREFPR